MNRTMSVTMTIAIAMLPVSCSKKTSRMSSAWKIGVNSQATAEIGSVGVAGWSGTEFGLMVGAAVACRRDGGARRRDDGRGRRRGDPQRSARHEQDGDGDEGDDREDSPIGREAQPSPQARDAS